jgi:phospholipid-transporting ATPase
MPPPPFVVAHTDMIFHDNRMVDKSLYVLFTLQACLCSFGAVANYIWLDNNRAKHWYLPYVQPANSQSYGTEAGLSWFTYLVLLDILVPISLYVSMELVKFTQAFYINRDLDMYYGILLPYLLSIIGI